MNKNKKIQNYQYDNLRYYFNKNLVEPILGKEYYNLGMDVYSCDRITTEDIINRFKCLENDKDAFMLLSAISFFINVCLCVVMFICLGGK